MSWASIGRGLKSMGKGIAEEGKAAAKDVGDGVVLARKSFSGDPQVRATQRAANRETWEFIKENPKEMAAASREAMLDPITTSWKEGDRWGACGRAVILGAGAVLPGVGAEKTVRIAKLAQEAALSAQAADDLTRAATTGANEAVTGASRIVKH